MDCNSFKCVIVCGMCGELFGDVESMTKHVVSHTYVKVVGKEEWSNSANCPTLARKSVPALGICPSVPVHMTQPDVMEHTSLDAIARKRELTIRAGCSIAHWDLLGAQDKEMTSLIPRYESDLDGSAAAMCDNTTCIEQSYSTDNDTQMSSGNSNSDEDSVSENSETGNHLDKQFHNYCERNTDCTDNKYVDRKRRMQNEDDAPVYRRNIWNDGNRNAIERCSITLPISRRAKEDEIDHVKEKCNPNKNTSWPDTPPYPPSSVAMTSNRYLKPDTDKVIKTQGIDNYKCQVCLKTFVHAQYLQQHVLSHTYTCQICSNMFPGLEPLCSHLAMHKREIKEYIGHSDNMEVPVGETVSCRLCGNRFLSQADLKRHLLFHISFDESGTPANTFDSFFCDFKHHFRKRFLCRVCFKSVKFRHSANLHLNVHLGKRAVCDVCEKTFSTPSGLRRHEKKKHMESTFDPSRAYGNMSHIKSGVDPRSFPRKYGHLTYAQEKPVQYNMFGRPYCKRDNKCLTKERPVARPILKITDAEDGSQVNKACAQKISDSRKYSG